MNQKITSNFILLTVTFALLTACGGLGGSSAGLSDDSLKQSPKESIAYQFELVQKGDIDKLKECFTDRIKENITSGAVEKGKVEAAKYTLDDLVASVEDGEADGKKTAKIKMKNGRTLTTLVQTDGKWLADTVWFK